jgi:hypothetical protein
MSARNWRMYIVYVNGIIRINKRIDARVLFRVYLTYQIKFYKIHVISMFKLSLIFCDSLVFFERKQFCVFFILVCLYLQCCWRNIVVNQKIFQLSCKKPGKIYLLFCSWYSNIRGNNKP